MGQWLEKFPVRDEAEIRAQMALALTEAETEAGKLELRYLAFIYETLKWLLDDEQEVRSPMGYRRVRANRREVTSEWAYASSLSFAEDRSQRVAAQGVIKVLDWALDGRGLVAGPMDWAKQRQVRPAS